MIELAKIIQKRQAEAQVIEVKSAHEGCPKKLYDTLSSFSNQDSGGTLVFGLNEKKQFEAVGVYDLQDLQKRITEQCNQMEPPVRAVFTIAEYQGVNICCAEIPGIELTKRPCYYKGIGRVKGSYIRVGDADLPMTDYELYAYEAYRAHLHDDERQVERASLKLLNQDKVAAYIHEKKNERPQFSLMEKEQIYEMLNLTREGIPTLAALLNFCVYPQGLFPQLGITAIVVPGYEIGDVGEYNARFIDNKRIEGTIAEMVEEAITFCKRNMKVKTIINPDTGMRDDKTEYPIKAIREAVLNALIHRDYSFHTEGTPVQINFFADRLEIHSPGTLYGRLTVEQLGKVKADLRNPALAVMTESITGAENRYSGIPTIIREMKEWGLPAPVFENRRNEFVVTLYNGSEKSGSMMVAEEVKPYDEGKTPESLLEFCREPKSRNEIAEFLGVKTVFYVMKRYIKPLLESGELAMTMPEKPKSKLQKYYTIFPN
ncbi:putative DNA binding domain-containing protein [Anaerovorax odorimutans]|uniref:DNA binding domain-containing protein n=1 Tax=Anaerovorax odorimutans TaxID=109327 RepID=A0ABT1RQK2_9FIRM|nr:putative DNA binding domain-containing protein [Anaerovorax odorimutans]